MKIKLTDNIRGLPSVGEKRAALFMKLGISTVSDLLYDFPRGYQHRGDVRMLSEVADGELAAFILTISSAPVTSMLKGRMTLTKLTAFDDSGKVKLAFFNQRYLQDTFTVGSVFRFWGKLTVQNGIRNLTSPAFERVTEGVPLPEFKALYHLTAGLTQYIVETLIKNVLSRIPNEDFPEILPAAVRDKLKLCSAAEAFKAVHIPDSYEQLEKGRQYFVFEELYLFSLCIAIQKRGARIGHAPIYVSGEAKFKCFLDALPYALTGAQSRSIAEIRTDLASGRPMRRMLSGDVGSGKTVVAAAAIFVAVSCGAQAALMAPTDILARQHYAQLSELFRSFRLETVLLTGSVSAAQKKSAYEKLKSGEAQIAIGTHALISEGVEFKNLGLVVTDEQHRFGVNQREAIAAKSGGAGCHTLVMSATPIPRSLAMVIYGDLELSQLDELPPGRQKVDTFLVTSSYSERLDKFITKQISLGGRVYVVCPAVEASEDPDDGEVIPFGYGYDAEAAANAALPMKNAVDEAQRLQAVLGDIAVGCMHGRMKGSEKDSVMRSFAEGKLQVLVSTTVIEVGVNVPEATLMIINNAERFGLSQLHQMRGRVGRGALKSYCVLVSDSLNAVTLERLNVIRDSSDGYEIAKRDLELRGPGDFLPTKSGEARQSGELGLKTASLSSDMDSLKLAAAEAEETLRLDPTLSGIENKAASDKLAEMMGLAI